jgi:hypothetical protein
MSETRERSAFIDSDHRHGDSVHDKIVDEIAQPVIAAYTAAVTGSEQMRRRAFDAALRAYRLYRPGVPERVARRQVARIICFAGTVPPD